MKWAGFVIKTIFCFIQEVCVLAAYFSTATFFLLPPWNSTATLLPLLLPVAVELKKRFYCHFVFNKLNSYLFEANVFTRMESINRAKRGWSKFSNPCHRIYLFYSSDLELYRTDPLYTTVSSDWLTLYNEILLPFLLPLQSENYSL